MNDVAKMLAWCRVSESDARRGDGPKNTARYWLGIALRSVDAGTPPTGALIAAAYLAAALVVRGGPPTNKPTPHYAVNRIGRPVFAEVVRGLP